MEAAELTSLQGGRYAIDRPLGEGGRGVVYRARDTALDRPVAVKVLKLEGLDDDSYARFVNEAQIAARLTHPNIVALYDMGREGGRPYLVMELVDGSSLRGILSTQAGHPLGLAQLLGYAEETAQALEYAHDKGVLHRDVKPENILVTHEGHVKLMDFGLARALDRPRLTTVGTMVGTPAYMAPENALGAEADARSDLYSLGVVVYEMATGSPPFRSPDSLKLIYSHIRDNPGAPSRLNAQLPSALESIILRLLAKDPADRYRSAKELRRALEEVHRQRTEVLGAQPVNGTPAAPGTPAGSAGDSIRTPTPEYRRSLPLVGRETEVVTLKGFVDGLLRGEGTTVLLTGEAGIGKTRVSDEMKAYAALRGARVLTGRCQESEGGAPYAPWVQLLQQVIRDATPAELKRWVGPYSDALAKLAPELGEKVPVGPQGPLGPAEQQQTRLFEGVTQFLLAVSHETPVILDVCNLNWADPGSLEVIHHVARAAHHQFAMLYLTYRDTEVEEDSPLSDLLLELNRERLARMITLRRLSREDVSRMIADTFEREVTPEFLDLVYSRTGGNPFFVEEVLRSLVEEGSIYRSDAGRWERKPIAEIEIPNSVRKVIERRLNRLDEEGHQVLRVAAVQGNEFRFDVLERVLAADEARLIDVVERCLKSRLVKERRISPRRVAYHFTDERVRDVLYAEMSAIRRSRYHLKTAQALEALSKPTERPIGELAHHFLLGNDAAKALEYSMAAGEEAMALYGYRDAYRHFATALELCEGEHPEERRLILERLGDAAWPIADLERMLKHWEEALRLAESRGDREGEAVLCRKIGYAYHFLAYDRVRALEYYDRAKAILDARTPSVELATIDQLLGRAYWFSAERLEEAADLCEKAIAISRQVGAHEAEAESNLTLALLTPARDTERAKTLMNRAMALGTEHHLSRATARAYLNIGHYQTVVEGDTDRALAILAEGLAYARATGESAYYAYLLAEQAFFCNLALGEWSKVREAAEEVGQLLPSGAAAESFPILLRASVLVREGDLDRAIEAFRRLIESCHNFHQAQFVSPARWGLARAYLDRDDHATAAREVALGLETVRRLGARHINCRYYIMLHAIAVELRVAEHDPAKAERALAELRTAVSEVDRPWSQAHLARAEGQVASLSGDYGRAVECLTRSAHAFGELKWPYERGWACHDLGVAELAAKHRSEAASAFNEAMELFTRLGARNGVRAVLKRRELLNA